MSIDSETEKRFKKFVDDIKLVTETAKVLAAKLEKLQGSLNELLPIMMTMTPDTQEKMETAARDTTGTPSSTSTPRKVTAQRPSRPLSRPTTRTPTARRPPSETTRPISTATDADTISSIFRFLREDVEKTTTGKEISRFLLDAQDKLLELKGFHPALREMRSLATEFKSREQVTKEDKTNLIEKTYDWEQRMLS